MKYNTTFVISVVMFSAFAGTSAGAAPSVKRLGTANASVSVQPTTLPTRAASSARTGSIRSTKAVNVKPVTVTKTVSAANADADQRLSVGKYIHSMGVNTGVIKPVVSQETVSASSGDIVGLTDRISDLETKVSDKQNILTPTNVINSGDGMYVTSVEGDNGTIVVNKNEITIPVGEPTSQKRANIWVE